jgi:hypothetical protein
LRAVVQAFSAGSAARWCGTLTDPVTGSAAKGQGTMLRAFGTPRNTFQRWCERAAMPDNRVTGSATSMRGHLVALPV